MNEGDREVKSKSRSPLLDSGLSWVEKPPPISALITGIGTAFEALIRATRRNRYRGSRRRGMHGDRTTGPGPILDPHRGHPHRAVGTSIGSIRIWVYRQCIMITVADGAAWIRRWL